MDKMIVNIQIDLSDAKHIILDTIHDDGTATLYVEYHSVSWEYRITMQELQRMCQLATFKWCIPTKNSDVPS